MKLKKLLATGLAAIMVMGLVGCSSSKGSDSSSEGSTATTDKLQQIKEHLSRQQTNGTKNPNAHGGNVEHDK